MSHLSIGEVLARLARKIAQHKSAGWDAAGLQLGDPARPARRVGVCHEVTEEVVTAVEAEPIDLLVTYHPLLFHPTTQIVAGRSPAGRALRLLHAGVAVAVTHTGFDATRGGTADALLEALELVGVGGFGPLESSRQVKIVTFLPAEAVEAVASAMATAGAGTIGNYRGCSFRTEGTGAFTAGPGADPVAGVADAANREPETRLEMVAPYRLQDPVLAALAAAHPYEEPAFDVYELQANLGFVGRLGTPERAATLAGLSARARQVFGEVGLRVSGDPALPCQLVAVVPGSGSSLIGAAAGSGADVLVTGDVPHHRVVEALDRGLAVIDPGHAGTERPGMDRLAALVDSVAPVTVDLTSIDPTPWQ